MFNLKKLHIFFLLTSSLLASCSISQQDFSKKFCLTQKIDCIKDNKTIVISSSKGKIYAEIFAKSSPITSSIFIHNLKEGLYLKEIDTKIFNLPNKKFIKVKPLKILSSDFNIISNIPLEIALKANKSFIYNKIIKDPKKLNNLSKKASKGSIVMNRSLKLDSGGTEFLILLDSLIELEGRYTVFGKVTNGLEILKNIDHDNLIIKEIKIVDWN